MIKEFMSKIENGDCSKTEFTFAGICLLLLGVVIGMLIAPSRSFYAGSFNGNSGSLANPEEIGKLIKKANND